MGGRSQRRKRQRPAKRTKTWPRRNRRSVLLGLLLVALGTLLMLAPYSDGRDTWRALQGEGRSGVFVAEEYKCGRRTCYWLGNFTSDDGQIIKPDVRLDTDPDDIYEGDETPALDVAEDRQVVYVSGELQPFLESLAIAAAGFGFFAFGILCMMPWRWFPRRLRTWAMT
ncbi:hypothetical protein [Nonomuraea endophytica]|uniref:hypothetical protein n=1 Tax=Nonomuraea endophytica TaxID=714136 RepID=UPI0037CC5954